MKKTLTLLALFLGLAIFAQAPNKMSYQAVIRDASNNLLANISIVTKVSILQGSSSGNVVYSETHTTSTNTNGLVTLEIGTGTVVSGTFSSIDWSTGNYYIKTETDPTGGTNYTISGTSQLLSVPFAMYANSSGGGSNSSAINYVGNSYLGQNSGVGSNGTTEGAFSNLENIAIGNTNLNVNSSGTNNVAIGNNSLSYNTAGNNNVSIGKNSLNANTTGYYNTAIGVQALQNNSSGYDNVGLGWGTLLFNTTGHGNTALGNGASTSSGNLTNATAIGYNATVNTSNSLVLGNNANVGIGTSSPTEKLEVNGKTKTTNFQMSNGSTNGYVLQSDASGNATWVNPSTLTTNAAVNYVGTSYLGKTSGAGSNGTSEGTSSNLYNIGIGANVLNANTSGNNNIALGQNALQANTTSSDNIAIGQNASQNSNGNAYYVAYPDVAIGYNSLKSNNYNAGNIAIGYKSQENTFSDGNTTGSINTSIGTNSMKNNYDGSGNVAVGSSSLYNNTIAESNTAIGARALFNTTTGYQNVGIGKSAGSSDGSSEGINTTVSNTNGSRNTFIGVFSGAGTNNLNNATAIGFGAQVNSSNSLVLGGTGFYAVNVGIGTNSPSQTLDVAGTTKTTKLQLTNGATNGYVLQSDASGNGSWVNSNTLSGTLSYVGNSYLGKTSGYGATGSSTGSANPVNIIAIGDNALKYNTTGEINIAIGNGALEKNTTGTSNNAEGVNALNKNTTGNCNVAYGHYALYSTTTTSNNSAIGFASLINSISGTNNTALGRSAMEQSLTGSNNTSLGYNSLYGNTNGSNNVSLGNDAGHNSTGSSNIFLGYNAGYNETGSDKLYIENSNSSTPLIYGDFSTNKVTINDSLESKYFKMSNGATSGYVLQSDSSGNGTWVNPSTLSNGNWTTSGSNQYSALSGNVGIGTSSPSNKLHVVGSQTIDAGRLVVQNTGNSIFVGDNTGINDNFSATNNIGIGSSCLTANVSGIDNIAIGRQTLYNNLSDRNIAIGRQSLYANTTGTYNSGLGILALNSNTTGKHNVGLGYGALYKNTTGENNVALGNYAGTNNLTGIGNVFLGYSSGYNETGSNKLYIDNSTTSTPLIWGDFSNDYVNINGNLGIGTSAPSNKLDIQSTSSVTANVQSSGSSAYYQADAPSGQEAAFLFNTYSSGSNVKRWAFGKSTAVESSSDAGSNFFINRYDDAGSYLGQPLAITRSTGQVVIGQSQPDSTESTLKLNGSVAVKVLRITTSNNSTVLDGTNNTVIWHGSSITGNQLDLPSASSCSGRIYTFINHTGSNITLTDGYYNTATNVLYYISANDRIQVISDGVAWHRMN